MPEIGGLPDILSDHNQVRERVRKLEIMPIRNIAPKMWKPSLGEPDAIAQFMLLIGTVNHLEALPKPGPIATFLWEQMMMQGFPSDAVAQQWTRFMQALGTMPPRGAWAALNTGDGPPPDAPHVGLIKQARDWGLGCATVGWGPEVSGVLDLPAGPQYYRTCLAAGLPVKGTWRHYNAGEFTGKPGLYAPGLTEGIKIYNREPPYWMVQPGAMMGEFEDGDPLAYRNNTYGFAVLNDCGDPPISSYSPYSSPGMPLPYPIGPQPCPNGNAIGAVYYGGDIWLYSLWLGGTDYFLIHPPYPPTQVAYSGTQFVVHDSDFQPFHGGIEWLMETIDLLLGGADPGGEFEGDIGEVKKWFDGAYPIAEAKAAVGSHANWQFLRPAAGWYGRVEVQIREGIAVMRGSLKCWTDNLRELGQAILWWPVTFGDRWQSYHGYVLPEIGLGTGHALGLTCRMDDGTPVPLTFQNRIEGLRYLSLGSGWGDSWDADHGYTTGALHEIELIFDGIQFVADYS